jgi:hypothetical protein
MVHEMSRLENYTLPFCYLFILGTIFPGCREKSGESFAPKGESYQSFTEDGAWCWFSDPRAIFYEGSHKRTYAGWVDSAGNIVVGYYDHDSRKTESTILHEKFEKDDHNNPSFLVDGSGRLMVFYSKHATGHSPIFFRRSKEPETITAWEPLRKLALNDTITYAGLSNTYTYTNILKLTDEDKMFLFWRGSDFKPNVSMSFDEGQRWKQGQILILPERSYKDRRPYIKVTSNNKDVIHFAFTDGHPNAEPTNSIYYVKYKSHGVFNANNEKIMDWSSLPLDPKQADLVYDATESKERAWIWDVAETSSGNPVVVYSRFPNDSSHVYYYGIFGNGQWHNHKLVDSGPWFPHTEKGETEREPNYSGGIVLDHQNPSTVILSRQKNGVFELEKWTTTDEGRTWSTKEITTNSKFDNVRPFVIPNYPGGDSLQILWMNVQRYRHYTDYQSAIKIAVVDVATKTPAH